MEIHELSVAGALELRPPCIKDARGSLIPGFDAAAFAAEGLPTRFVFEVTTHSRRSGTLRGLHMQRPPPAQTKLAHAVTGRAFDVIVDLRAGSGYGRWTSTYLDAALGNRVLVPEGCAHGILTMVPDTAIHYLMTAPYRTDAECRVRWDDPELAIPWPLDGHAPVLSDRDASAPYLAAVQGASP